MAVLKLEPTKAPNFRSTSLILARAGLGLDRAFESAQGVLGSFQDGQSEKADNEVFAEVSQLNSREEIEDYFAKNGVAGRPISKDMRDRLGGLLAGQADLNTVRDTRTRANAKETRTAGEFLDLTGKRAEQRSGAAGDARAYIEGKTFGELGTPGVNRDAPVTVLPALAVPGEPGTPGITSGGVTPAGDPIALAATANPPQSVGGVPTVGGGSRAPAHLVGNESGGDFGATNESVGSGGVKGHDGRVQAGAARLQDAKNAGVIPKGMTREQFRNDPEAQIAFENWHFDDIDSNIEKQGYGKYIGTTINGVEVTHQGMADVQHLGGATGLKKFLESNGTYNVADDNGTTLTDYLKAGGEATAKSQAPGAFTPPTVDDPATRTAEVDPLAALRAIGDGTPGLSERGPSGPRTDAPQVALAEAQAAGVPSVAATLAAATGAPVKRQPTTVAEAITPPVADDIMADPNQFRDARIEQILASKFMTGPEMIAAIKRVEDGSSEGEAAKLEQNAKDRQEMLIRVGTQWAEDPNASAKPEDLAKIFRDLPGTASEKLAAGLFALSLLGEGGALESVNRPGYIKDEGVARGVAREKESMRRQMEAKPIFRMLNNAQLFGDDDPVNGVWEFLDLDNDDQKAEKFLWFGDDGADKNLVRQIINDISRDAEVSPGEAAAGLVEMFKERDPDFWNTNANRYRPDVVTEMLKLTLSDPAREAHLGDLETIALKTDDLERATLGLTLLRTQRTKMDDSNSTSAERTAADAEIKRQQLFLKQGSTWYEGETALKKYMGNGPEGHGYADLLSQYTIGSPEHTNAVGFIKLQIQDDPRLSPTQKRLLLATINS